MKSKFNVGDEVYWNDPNDGIRSDYGIIISLDYDVIDIELNSGLLIEVYEKELS